MLDTETETITEAIRWEICSVVFDESKVGEERQAPCLTHGPRSRSGAPLTERQPANILTPYLHEEASHHAAVGQAKFQEYYRKRRNAFRFLENTFIDAFLYVMSHGRRCLLT